MKKLIAVSALALLTLTGCASEGGHLDAPSTPEPPKTLNDGGVWSSYENKLYANTVILPDGRTITCVILADQVESKSIGGLSCDWDHANVDLWTEEER